jgi:hypothetical protein
MMDTQSVPKGGIFCHLADARMDLVVDQVQFLRFHDAKDLACELTLKSAYLCDNGERAATLWCSCRYRGREIIWSARMLPLGAETSASTLKAALSLSRVTKKTPRSLSEIAFEF